MPFPALTLLANPRNLAIAGLTLALVAASLFGYVQTVRLEAANTRADALGQRLVNANEQVQAAVAGQRTCAAANQSNLSALQACHAATGALRAETVRLDAALAGARRQAATVMAEADAEDRAIEARPDLTPAAELNRVLRARGEGWLWR